MMTAGIGQDYGPRPLSDWGNEAFEKQSRSRLSSDPRFDCRERSAYILSAEYALYLHLTSCGVDVPELGDRESGG